MLEERSGAGSAPASFKVSHTVEAATVTPRTSSSPGASGVWVSVLPDVFHARECRAGAAGGSARG
ncbi:hypothetical protein SAMN02787118_122132 [Streptomyces mirabilis]|jgi:hypothetical protein|uniref:Uncharacterized protein n=1 Tax=Streptomyces mirabilis TaxID=68239 RepID=A0A1I2SSL9_9ACTN|nr:hypothetical protein SAMN02787118_122132 [Streptomyces mirabilis]